MNTKTVTPTSVFRLMHYIMLQAVVSFALAIDNVGITDSIPAFRVIINKLKAKLALIAPLMEFNSRSLKYFANRRKALKQSISQNGNIIMSAVYNYAVSISDGNLQELMKSSKSGLFRLKYDPLVSRMNDVINIITPLLPQLATFDVTPEQLDALKADVLEMASISPKNIYSTRSANKKEIQKLLRECMTIIYNESDKQAQSFQKQNQPYYDAYLFNRKLYPNTRHTKFKVHVTDELNQPIAEVNVLQNETTNSSNTDINGDATVYIKVEDGKKPIYNFTISKGTQSKETGLIQIKKGETISQNIIMQPTGFIIPAPVSETVNA